MARSLSPDVIALPGILVDRAELADRFTIIAQPVAASARCPGCDQPSSSVHSRYTRTLADLPVAGRQAVIEVGIRRFRCAVSDCPTRIFAERLGPDLAGPYARRTARLESIVHHLGLALGGRPAERLSRRLVVPASRDTMLRSVRRHAARPVEAPRVIGIDDWAFRRGRRYGTIIVDLERRRTLALLPDRESGTVEAWLSAHPEITIVARDRGGGYGEATTRALPDAVQTADRWHLMENASAAFLDAVRRSMPAIRKAVGAATVDPERLTRAERVRYEGYLRREATGEAILALSRKGGRSRRSLARPATAASSSATWCAAWRATCSAPARAALRLICPGWRASGGRAAGTGRSCGGNFVREGSPVVCGWSESGRHGSAAASRSRTAHLARFRRLVGSRVC